MCSSSPLNLVSLSPLTSSVKIFPSKISHRRCSDLTLHYSVFFIPRRVIPACLTGSLQGNLATQSRVLFPSASRGKGVQPTERERTKKGPIPIERVKLRSRSLRGGSMALAKSRALFSCVRHFLCSVSIKSATRGARKLYLSVAIILPLHLQIGLVQSSRTVRGRVMNLMFLIYPRVILENPWNIKCSVIREMWLQ